MTAKKNILQPLSISAMIFSGIQPSSVHAQNWAASSTGIGDIGHLLYSFVFMLEVVMLGTILSNRVAQTFADTL